MVLHQRIDKRDLRPLAKMADSMTATTKKKKDAATPTLPLSPPAVPMTTMLRSAAAPPTPHPLTADDDIDSDDTRSEADVLEDMPDS